MERRILKNSSILLMITVVAVLGLEYYFNTYGKEMQQEQMSGLKMLAYNTEQAEMSDEAEFEQQLCIELPQGMTLDEVIIENDYVKQLITIRIPDVEDNYFLEHPLLGRSNNINDLYMANGRIEITMDAVYEPECTVEDGRLYLDFLQPQDIYDKVVVIDAGHGGGALALSSRELWKRISILP